MRNNRNIRMKMILNMDRFSDLIQLISTVRAPDFFVNLDYRLKFVAKEQRNAYHLLCNCPIFAVMKKVDAGWSSSKYFHSQDSSVILIQIDFVGELTISKLSLLLTYWNPTMLCLQVNIIPRYFSYVKPLIGWKWQKFIIVYGNTTIYPIAYINIG